MTNRAILGPGTFDDVPFHEHDFNELSGELIVSEAQITSLSATKITAGTIGAHTIIISAGGTIESHDFVTGPGGAGYQLSGGLAEFNNITVRGTIFSGAGSDIDYAHVTSVNIQTADIGNLQVTAGKIATGTITAAQIDAVTITAAEIANGTITATQIQAGTITATEIDDLTITGGKIGNLEITATQIDNLTITSGKIGNSEVKTVNVGDAEITSAKIDSLNVNKLTAGTIGVHVIKLSNSSGSRIESNNGTSMIIRGDGSAVFTNVTVTGTVNASAGSITGNITVAATLGLPNVTAANRIELHGGSTPEVRIISTQGTGGATSVVMRVGTQLVGRLKPADSGSVEFTILEGLQEYLYLTNQFTGGAQGAIELVAVGRQLGDAGFGAHPVSHAIGFLTKNGGDTPVSIYNNAGGGITSGGTHVVIHSENTDNELEFHLKCLTRGGAGQVNQTFRMDGRNEANGSGKGWFTTSDERLKKWLEPVDTADMIARIRGIPIFGYADKGEKDKDRPRRIGPTAQGVQPHFPNSVSAGAPGEPLGLETNETVWGLVAVVQDLLDRIDTLEAQAA